MRSLRRVVFVVFVLLLILAILGFVLENQQAVSLLFFGWTGPQLPVSVVVVIALLVGMLIGPCIAWLYGRIARVRRKHLA
ncbi:LapA family protein [Pseudomonas sp. 6D_7.1_Bac1]|jgi:putative membrane protein|uniref:LapA family protein n=1 Tax=Pseudomonas sp. 6D_7.1_Bac1 TaxID=2971615 RepID=UPI0021C603E2|nr:LapA family protein [Pseudomonas sp. 6D_7.1_Bac1]MCU1748473.1 LapA family protein [Pseudomonas sp. 6D_7.1_Bac1]